MTIQTCVSYSASSDIHLVWNEDGYFQLSVAKNRLPDLAADLTTPATLSAYFERVRSAMHPIGLPSDGWSSNFAAKDALLNKISSLSAEGYRIPDHATLLINQHEGVLRPSQMPKPPKPAASPSASEEKAPPKR